jgi:hypothetical protein
VCIKIFAFCYHFKLIQHIYFTTWLEKKLPLGQELVLPCREIGEGQPIAIEQLEF